MGLVTVALRKESVDRNSIFPGSWILAPVALRKESVDRNHDLNLDWIIKAVALRKESVDRNTIWEYTSKSIASRSPQGERG